MSDTQSSMSVEEFVRTALSQIQSGMRGNSVKCSSQVIEITFEIGVDVIQSKETSASGGLGLSVASVVNLGSKGKTESGTENRAYNKLTFTVPIFIAGSAFGKQL